jgi:3-dehydroquinate synthase
MKTSTPTADNIFVPLLVESSLSVFQPFASITPNPTAKMSDLKASVAETPNGFHVEGYEKIEYDFAFIDNIFDTNKADLAACYKRWGRCLAVMDLNIFNLYGEQMQAYFDHYDVDLSIHKTMIGEKAKSIETLLSIVDSMTQFGIFRKVGELRI